MDSNKIIRSLCYFSLTPDSGTVRRLDELSQRLTGAGYQIQTRRICTSKNTIYKLDQQFIDPELYLCVGTVNRDVAILQLNDFLNAQNVSFNLDLSAGVYEADVEILFQIIRRNPAKTFNFTYTFQNVPSSPFFPSAHYERDGFAIGLQPTDLAANCVTLNEWLLQMKTAWLELADIFRTDADFLGIDSSIAPLFSGDSSLLHFIKKLKPSFSASVTSDLYVTITKFLKTENPQPVGLCGLMFPCLEDFELAAEYEAGHFTIERNLFLSLHSGLGIDTYPIGSDESPQRVLEILNLLCKLAAKYHKPLSARFVSDGKAKIGDKSDFGNQYLRDVVIRPL